jgi:hypothetical protein
LSAILPHPLFKTFLFNNNYFVIGKVWMQKILLKIG